MTHHPLDSLDDDIRDHIERETQDNLDVPGVSASAELFEVLRRACRRPPIPQCGSGHPSR